jgi:hypothetical protein
MELVHRTMGLWGSGCLWEDGDKAGNKYFAEGEERRESLTVFLTELREMERCIGTNLDIDIDIATQYLPAPA